MGKTTTNTSAATGESGAQARVAYHAGPPEIEFAGRHWRIGVAQPVAPEDYAAMRARADFAQFEFSTEE